LIGNDFAVKLGVDRSEKDPEPKFNLLIGSPSSRHWPGWCQLKRRGSCWIDARLIARMISQGKRAAQGTRAFGPLASVIETCRKRKILPWPSLAEVIAERRQGNPAQSFASVALVG
jgi:hypothetical protein